MYNSSYEAPKIGQTYFLHFSRLRKIAVFLTALTATFDKVWTAITPSYELRFGWFFFLCNLCRKDLMLGERMDWFAFLCRTYAASKLVFWEISHKNSAHKILHIFVFNSILMAYFTLMKHRHVTPTYYKHGIASNMWNHISSNISFKYKNHNFHVNSFTYNDGILDSIPTSWMLYLQVHLQVWPWHKSQLLPLWTTTFKLLESFDDS